MADDNGNGEIEIVTYTVGPDEDMQATVRELLAAAEETTGNQHDVVARMQAGAPQGYVYDVPADVLKAFEAKRSKPAKKAAAKKATPAKVDEEPVGAGAKRDETLPADEGAGGTDKSKE